MIINLVFCLYNRYLILVAEVILITQTHLYNLEPVGLQTGMVESMSSYLTRLAEAHSLTVGTMIGKEIALTLNKQYLLRSASEGGSIFYNAGHELNGIGNLAADWSHALDVLTGRADLENLTLIRFNEWLPERGVLRKSLAWCPACLEEWRVNQRQIYEPLLWNFQSVTHCINHEILLQTECPNCEKKVQILNRKRRIGYCSNCGAWLGRLKTVVDDVVSAERFNWQSFVIKNVGDLISTEPKKLREFSSTNIHLAELVS